MMKYRMHIFLLKSPLCLSNDSRIFFSLISTLEIKECMRLSGLETGHFFVARPGPAQSGQSIREARRARLNFSSARRFSRPAGPGPGPKDISIYKNFSPVEFGDHFSITINILGNN
jgi:hypothetical protein